MKRIFMGIFAVVFALSFLCAFLPKGEAAELDGAWYYRYGDPVMELNGPEGWIQSAMDHDTVWKRFDFPYLPQTGNQHYVWLTTTLRGTDPHADTIFFWTYHESVQVWLDNQVIYEYGTGEPRYLGYGQKWHMVSLPHFRKKVQLTIRVYSDLPLYLAPLRDFRMDEDIVLAQHVFLADIVYAISLPILLLFSFIIGIYYFNQPDRRKLQRDSIIALALIALFSFCECSVKQWFCDWPVLWQHLALICIYLLPIATNQVIYDIVENKYKPLIKHIQHACAVLAVVALCSEVLGFHGLDYGMFGYYLLLLVCQTAVIRTLWQSARGGNPYSYAMFPPCLVLSLLAVFDGMNMNAQWFMGPFYLMPLGAVTLLSFVLVIVKDQLDRERRLESSAIQLEAQAARAVERSEIDPLTGCLNRNAYDKILAHEVKLKDPSFCLVMLDIDHFKLVNDSFGHDAGDQVLRRVTETVREHISHQMKFFRWGGEEFVIYCPQMSRLEAAEVAELLRVAVVDARILPQQPVTISLGVASWHGEQDDLDAMFRRLDSALYRAKRTGRNRVEIE